MIGTNIRGMRHLMRVCDTTPTPLLIKLSDSGYDFCAAFKTEKDSQFGESLVIFNNIFKHSPYGITSYLSTKQLEPYRDMLSNFDRVWTIHNPLEVKLLVRLQEIVLLPKTFFSDYADFVKNNSKMFKSLNERYSFSKDDINVMRIYMASNGSKNFFSWAINAFFTDSASLLNIISILKWNDFYGQLSKNLSKGTITAYNTRVAIGDLMDEMCLLRKNKRMADAINSFNTAQKKLLKSHELSNIDKETLSKFSKLSETKQLNFIKKASTIDSFDELMRLMRHVCSIHFEWNKASFKDYIENVENLNYKVVFDKGDIILLEVSDYETIKQLAKTTNWCISKNKSYWNNYVESDRANVNQYLIFDFSKKEDDRLSIVGFTTKYNKGITHAHDFVNNPLMEDGQSPTVVLIKSYVSKFLTNNNIYSIIASDGIDINLVANYDKPLYEWDRNAVIKYLHECVNTENIDILVSNGYKMAISVRDSNIRYFLGDTYHDNIPSECWNWQHILFFDFSLSKYDTNKLQFAIIRDGGYGEDVCQGFYNENSTANGVNLEAKLIEYGLPYDIIRRTDDIMVKMRDAINSFNMPMINDCMGKISNRDLKILIEDYIGQESFYNLILLSVKHYVSFDYLNLVYDNGMFINNIVGSKRATNLCRDLISSIISISRRLILKHRVPSKEDIDNFYAEKIEEKQYTLYVGYYLIVTKILESEKFTTKQGYNQFAKGILDMVCMIKNTELFNAIFKLIGKKLNFTIKDDSVMYWISYASVSNDDELKGFADEVQKKISESSSHKEKEKITLKYSPQWASVTTSIDTSLLIEDMLDGPF